MHKNPFILNEVDALFYAAPTAKRMAPRLEVAKAMLVYIEYHLSQNALSAKLLRSIQNLFNGQRHTKRWRRALSEEARGIDQSRLVDWLYKQLELFELELS